MNVLNGTSCGTNEVCDNGTCTMCASGGSCTPANVCDTGTLTCSAGMPSCTDSHNPVMNGTSCGTNAVCDDGSCISCTQGASCTPALCQTGTLNCASGMPVCNQNGIENNGTGCGTNEVCYDGNCSVCNANKICTPPVPCEYGETSCATGVQTCVPTSPYSAGTACIGGVCDGNGNCVLPDGGGPEGGAPEGGGPEGGGQDAGCGAPTTGCTSSSQCCSGFCASGPQGSGTWSCQSSCLSIEGTVCNPAIGGCCAPFSCGVGTVSPDGGFNYVCAP
jgi:hypothetical protein